MALLLPTAQEDRPRKKTILCAVALFIAAATPSNSAEPGSEVRGAKGISEKVDQGDLDKRSERAEKTADALRQQVREEIKSLGHHVWAGEYYFGDGLGVNVSLILAPKFGYVFEWRGCLGLYDRNYGAVTSTKGLR
jgi:hypothetical protein